MKYKLAAICHYVKGKVDVSKLDNSTYISTENMLPDKGGVTVAATLPTTAQTQIFEQDDVLVSNIRPYFKKIWFANQDGGCSNDVLVFRANEGVEPGFLYYVLADNKFFNYSMATSKGTKMPRGDKKALMEYEVPDFDIDTQRKVASLLGDIDDKIRVNNELNKNLQSQLRALYKAWFVDYDYFGGEQPTTWSKGKLKDILFLHRNAVKSGDNPSLPYLPIDIIPMNTFALSGVKPNEEAKSSLIIFNKDDIVIGAMRVYFHRVILAPFEGITRTTCFTLSAIDNDYLSFALLCCDQDSTIDYAQSTSKGSTMPYAIWDGGLGDMEIFIPDRSTAANFNELAMPMIRRIQLSYFENIKLISARDALLPKLMSGEIDVSDIDL